MRLKNTIIRFVLFLISNNQAYALTGCPVPDLQLFGTIHTDSTSTPYWSPVTGATEYNFRYRIRNAGNDYSTPVTIQDTLITLSSLPPSTDYEFIVQTVCQNDTSTYSASGWFTTMSAATAPQLTRGPFMTVSSSSGVTIQWSTHISCNSEVKFGTSPGSFTDWVTDNTLTTDHVVKLENLLPGNRYYYSIGKIGYIIDASQDNYFYTAPPDNDPAPLKFWVTGDFGTGTADQEAVRDAFAVYTSGQRVDGWLWLGDNAYANGTDQEYQDKVFDVYPDQLRNIPLFPALGNHDYAQCGYLSSAARGTNFPYFDIFSLPNSSGTEKYYSANYGNVHLIALDSYGAYNTPGSPMYNWLQTDLMNNTQQWTIVYFHHGPYSKGSHDSDNSQEMSDMREHILPLLESYGVDLVLSGHSHSYERSYFINGHYDVESTFNSAHMVQQGGENFSKTSRTGAGTVYIVCGVGGKTSGTTSGWPHDAMYYSTASMLGSLIIDIDGSDLKCSFLTGTGIVADDFTISKPPVNTTGTNEAKTEKSVTIYPNPSNGMVNIQAEKIQGKNALIKIFNQGGQQVYCVSVSVSNGNLSVRLNKTPMEKFASGFYFVTVQDDEKVLSERMVIN